MVLATNNINVIYPTGTGSNDFKTTLLTTPTRPTPTTTPPLADPGIIAGINPLDVAAATYGKVIPIVVGGCPRIGGYIIYGPKFTTVASLSYVSFGASFGLQADSDGERELWEIRMDGVKVWTIEDGALIDGLTFRFTEGTEVQEPDAMLVADYGDAAPAFRSQCCLFFENLAIARFDNHVPFVSAVLADVTDGADPSDGILLGDALERLANSAFVGLGSDQFETTGITTVILGLIEAERGSFIDLLQRLARLFPLDIVQTDKLRVIERSSIAADIVLNENRIVGGRGAVQIQRQSETDVAQELEFIHIDIDRDYEFTPQKARRPSDPVAITASRAKETINLPIVTTASNAISWVTLRKYWDEVARTTVSFTAMPYGMEIDPGTMVAVKLDLATYVVRIAETLHEARGTVKCVGAPVLRCSVSVIDDGPEIGDSIGGAAFVAVGFNNSAIEVWSSADGADWSEDAYPGAATYSQGVSDRDGSLFVVAGGEGEIATSADGSTWSLATVPAISGLELFAVNCGNPSMCVAVGDDTSDPVILTSTTGATWTQQTAPVSNATLYGAAYGGGVHVVVGAVIGSGAAVILSSPDGVAWTSRTVSPSGASPYAVAHDGAQFIAVGTPNAAGPPAVTTSPDGAVWSNGSGGTGALGDGDFNGIACSATQTVAVGRYGGAAGIATYNGSVWTDRSPAGFASGTLFGVSYIGTTWVAVGDTGGGTPQNLIFLSDDDGLTWAQQTTPVSAGRLFGVVGRGE